MRYSTSYAEPGLKMREHDITAPGILVNPITNWGQSCLTSVIKWVPGISSVARTSLERTPLISPSSGTHLITEVKQRWARILLGVVTTQMTSMPGAVRRCTRILWPGKASKRHREELVQRKWALPLRLYFPR
jgi:hypothetical protein